MSILTYERHILITRLLNKCHYKNLRCKPELSYERQKAFCQAINNCICASEAYKKTQHSMVEPGVPNVSAIDFSILFNRAVPVLHTMQNLITSSVSQDKLTLTEAPLTAFINEGFSNNNFAMGMLNQIFKNNENFKAIVEYFLPNYSLDIQSQAYKFNSASINLKQGWNYDLTPASEFTQQ